MAKRTTTTTPSRVPSDRPTTTPKDWIRVVWACVIIVLVCLGALSYHAQPHAPPSLVESLNHFVPAFASFLGFIAYGFFSTVLDYNDITVWVAIMLFGTGLPVLIWGLVHNDPAKASNLIAVGTGLLSAGTALPIGGALKARQKNRS